MCQRQWVGIHAAHVTLYSTSSTILGPVTWTSTTSGRSPTAPLTRLLMTRKASIHCKPRVLCGRARYACGGTTTAMAMTEWKYT